MKGLNKTFVLILSFCLAFMCFSSVFVDAAAVIIDSPAVTIKKISLANRDAICLVENIDGEYADGYFRYEPDYDDYDLLFTYSDGTYYTVNMGFLLHSGLITVSDTQDEVHWVSGNVYKLQMRFGGNTYNLPVRIYKDRVKSITVLRPSAIEVTEYIDGYWTTTPGDDSGEEWFCYNYDEHDIELEIEFTNGNIYTARPYDYFEDFQVSIVSDQYKEHWYSDGNPVVTVGYMGHTADIPVVFDQNPVSSFTYTGAKLELMERTNGRVAVDNDGNEYFDYYVYTDEMQFEVVFADGTQTTLRAYEDFTYENVRENIRIESNQFRNHWTSKDENYINAYFFGNRISIPVTITENPVESIEIVSPGSITVTEYADGGWDYRYNEETQMDERYFRYNIPWDLFVITVHYKDGEQETVNAYELDGRNLRIGDNQFDTPWESGADNTLVVEYLGATDEIPVIIEENPVESIEIVSPDSLTLTENAYGGRDYYYNNETQSDEEYFRYDIQRDLFEITIHYKGGKEETVNADELDGRLLKIGDNQHNNPWKTNTENVLVVEYMGVTDEIPVIIEENPVESIEIVSPESLTFTENAYGWWDYYYNDETHRDEEYFRYDIPWSLFEITVNYKDGRHETFCADELDGRLLKIGDNQHNSPWKTNTENVLSVEYMGAYDYIPLTIEEAVFGDVDADREVNIVDLIKLKKYIISDFERNDVWNADLNNDERVDSLDLCILRNWLFNKDFLNH